MIRVNECQLDPPPSTNAMWTAHRGGMQRSARYNRWLDYAVDQMTRQLRKVPGQVQVTITLYEGKGITSRSDLDNLAKPVMDALKGPSYTKPTEKKPIPVISKPGASIIEDDNLTFVRQIFLRTVPRAGKKAGDAFITVEVEPFGGES